MEPRHIVGIGGTVRADSSSEQALRVSLARAEQAGASTILYGADELSTLQLYSPGATERNEVAKAFIEDLRRADGVIISSPAYHGSVSGMVKNALDYVEDLREDDRPYLTDRSMGLIVAAYGWQAAVTTLLSLRSIAHALRGWVTPYGAAINSLDVEFADGACSDARTRDQLELVADEVVSFADMRANFAGRQPAAATSPGA